MINQVYRLVAPKQIRIDFVEEHTTNTKVMVRPTYLSICAADQRYYQGNRDKKVMNKKLPMALIHEAVGEVVYDPSGSFTVGTKVVMIPNTPTFEDSIIKDNYLRNSKFRASGYDGFMQSVVAMDPKLIIPFTNIEPRIAVLLELLSVTMNAVSNFNTFANQSREVIAVWGSGSLGFITSLVLKKLFPNSKIVVMGVRQEKLEYFSFVDATFTIDAIPKDLKIDHAFEVVGGNACEDAINQMIDYIQPQGTISLMGVSENNVSINTRMVLEKGLILLGNSRSSYVDFKAAVDFLESNDDAQDYLNAIISEEISINCVEDIHDAFDRDSCNEFKTIMKWNI